MRAARETNAFNELAVACAYQQRHTLELAIKALIEMFHVGAADSDEIARITSKPTTSTAPPQDEVARLTRCHDLRFRSVVNARGEGWMCHRLRTMCHRRKPAMAKLVCA